MESKPVSSGLRAALGVSILLTIGLPSAFARQYFDSPEAAMTAFGEAVISGRQC